MDSRTSGTEQRGGGGGRFGSPNWSALKNFFVRVPQLISLPEFIAFAVGHATTRPTCDSSRRDGEINTRGAAGVYDVKYICQKNTSDAYAWRPQVVGPTGGGSSGQITYWTATGELGSEAALFYNAISNTFAVDGGIYSTSATSGIGYSAGGAVTQLTSKATGVTLNKVCGQITTHNAALAAAAEVSFVVTNSTIVTTDCVVVNHDSGGTLGAYGVFANNIGAGAFSITLTNLSAGSLSEALTLNFAIIRAVAA